MSRLVLEDNIKEVLEVVIGDATYNIPLAASLSWKEANEIKTNDDVVRFFLNYIPEDIFNKLSIKNITAIIEEWRKTSETDSGVKLGQ